MKTLLTVLVLLISCILQTAGQNSYYYYQGRKIPLTRMTNKVVITTKGQDKNVIKESSDIRLIRRLNDKHNTVGVYRIKPGVLEGITAINLPVNTLIDPCYTSKDGTEEYIPTGYFNIMLKSESDKDLLSELVTTYNVVIVEKDPIMPLWYLLRRGDNCTKNTLDLVKEIYETRKFRYCSPEFEFNGMDFSYDQYIQNQWGLYNQFADSIDLSVAKAWDYATGRDVKISIVDYGINFNHEDLRNNIFLTYDCESGTTPTKISSNDHGTLCAGVAAAVRNNGIGIAGVAPDAKLMAAGFEVGTTYPYCSIARGIYWSSKNGADVISCSWTTRKQSDVLDNAFLYAITNGRNKRGCVIVTSAGNDTSVVNYPGNFRKEIIAVGSVDTFGVRLPDCCFGKDLFVMAPGNGILSTSNDNEYKTYDGTSAACPHVAGVAALILERNPSLSALKVREIIGKSTKRIGDVPYDTEKEFGKWNQWYGYGLIDAYKAIINTPRQND